MPENSIQHQASVVSIKKVDKGFKIKTPGNLGFWSRFIPSVLQKKTSLFHSLKGISLDVPQGSTIGIIGRNGSGKTTLLKIICGIMTPTSGEVRVRGKIATLLDLGAGFDPEFTGLENAYMNGALMGFTKARMDEKIQDIIDFADIGEFVNRPVKTYSSGMYVRLAFSVAIHADPDILVVDETLAVGDAAFRRKCFARINQIRKNGGTIVLVSHSLNRIVELCHEAVWIDSGEIVLRGDPALVVSEYEKFTYANLDLQNRIVEKAKKLGVIHKPFQIESSLDGAINVQNSRSYDHNGATISNPRILSKDGTTVNTLAMGEEYCYTYDVTFDQDAECVRFGMMIKTQSGFELGGSVSHPQDEGVPSVKKGSTLSPRFTFRCQLLPDFYFINSGVQGAKDAYTTYLHRIIDAVMFRVVPRKGILATGLVDFSNHLDNKSRVSVEYGGDDA